MWKPRVAGALNLAAGIPATGGGIAVVLVGGGLSGLQFPTWLTYLQGLDVSPALSGIGALSPLLLGALGAVLLPLGLIAVLGGVEAIRRRHWRLALAGALCGAVCIPVLGIPSGILLILSRDRFEAVRAAGGKEGSPGGSGDTQAAGKGAPGPS